MSKTIVGLLVSLLGLIGVAQFISESELTQFIDLAIQLGGLLWAWYGRYKAVLPITAIGTYEKI